MSTSNQTKLRYNSRVSLISSDKLKDDFAFCAIYQNDNLATVQWLASLCSDYVILCYFM